MGSKSDQNCTFACVPFESKFKLLKDFSNTAFALLEGYLWSKLTPDIYLSKVFHLTKSWGVKTSLKISFLAQFRLFLNTAIKIVVYLMHHLACHHWSKVQTKLNILGSSGQKTTQKHPKMTVSTGTKTFENLKFKNYRSDIAKIVHYMYHLNPFHLLKTESINQREGTSEKNIKKFQEFIKFLSLIWLKYSLWNATRLWISPVFNNTFTANILGMREKRRGFTPHTQVFPY